MDKQEILNKLEYWRKKKEEYNRKGWFESIMATTGYIEKLEEELEKMEEFDILEGMERENLENIDWQEMDDIDRICKLEGF